MRKEEISDADTREVRSQLDAMKHANVDPETEIVPGKGRNTVSERNERESVTGTHGHGGEDDQPRKRRA